MQTRNLLCFGEKDRLPFGFWAAESDQLNWSEEESSKSRQSEMAVERRESPRNLVNGEKMSMTWRTTPMVERTELENSEEGTFKHSVCSRSAAGAMGKRISSINSQNLRWVLVSLAIKMGLLRWLCLWFVLGEETGEETGEEETGEEVTGEEETGEPE